LITIPLIDNSYDLQTLGRVEKSPTKKLANFKMIPIIKVVKQ